MKSRRERPGRGYLKPENRDGHAENNETRAMPSTRLAGDWNRHAAGPTITARR
jgi:hypothetical protein